MTFLISLSANCTPVHGHSVNFASNVGKVLFINCESLDFQRKLEGQISGLKGQISGADFYTVWCVPGLCCQGLWWR